MLPYNVDQCYNQENSVIFSQVIQCADNIMETLCCLMLSAHCMTCENNTELPCYNTGQHHTGTKKAV